MDSTLGDHGAVGLVNDAIDLLEVIGVGDDLVTSEDILKREKLASLSAVYAMRSGLERREREKKLCSEGGVHEAGEGR